MKALAFDRFLKVGQSRMMDDNGFLHVEGSNLTKVGVFPYLGREIPNSQELGLDLDAVYQVLRPEDELRKATVSFNRIPVLSKHVIDGSEETDARRYRVGSTGDKAVFEFPYVKNSLTVFNVEDIENIEKGFKREISAAYWYVPVKKAGVFEGQPYDLVMTEISANHVALVEKGRSGKDVLVADSAEETQKGTEQMKLEQIIEKVTGTLKGAGVKEDVIKTILSHFEEPAKDDDKSDDKKDESKEEDKGKESKTEKKAEDEKTEDSKDGDKSKEAKDEDKKDESKEDDKKDEDKGKEKKDAAMDAMKAIEDSVADRFHAARAVVAVLGEINPMSFDSGEAIYRKALQISGVATDGCKDCKAVFTVHQSLSAKQKKPAQDAAKQDDKDLEVHFKGLGNIKQS